MSERSAATAPLTDVHGPAVAAPPSSSRCSLDEPGPGDPPPTPRVARTTPSPMRRAVKCGLDHEVAEPMNDAELEGVHDAMPFYRSSNTTPRLLATIEQLRAVLADVAAGQRVLCEHCGGPVELGERYGWDGPIWQHTDSAVLYCVGALRPENPVPAEAAEAVDSDPAPPHGLERPSHDELRRAGLL